MHFPTLCCGDVFDPLSPEEEKAGTAKLSTAEVAAPTAVDPVVQEEDTILMPQQSSMDVLDSLVSHSEVKDIPVVASTSHVEEAKDVAVVDSTSNLEDVKDITVVASTSLSHSEARIIPECFSDEQLVAVTVPEGILPGQMLTVRSPDGSRTVSAEVPDDIQPGESFMVRFPPAAIDPPRAILVDGVFNPVMNVEDVPRLSTEPIMSAPLDGEDEFAEAGIRTSKTDSLSPETSLSFTDALDKWFNGPAATTPAATTPAASTPAASSPTVSTPKASTPAAPSGIKAAAAVAAASAGTVAAAVAAAAGEGAATTENADKDNNRSLPIDPEADQNIITITSTTEAEVEAEEQLQSSNNAENREPVEDREVPERSLSLVETLEQMLMPSSSPPKAAVSPTSPRSPPALERKLEEEEDTTPKQKVLLVHVPKGMPAGSTIHVEVPGEHRTLAAVVPPGVAKFHVAYTPSPMIPPEEHFLVPPAQAMSKIVQQTHAMPGKRLLMVRVPPGTAPGATLHVSVPDEPGRLLAAQVPGDVDEFHVSYEPRVHQSHPNRAMLPPANPYYHHLPQSYYHPQQYHSQQQAMMHQNRYIQHPHMYQQQQAMIQQHSNYNTSPGYMAPFVGGPAVGVTGVPSYEHYRHQNSEGAYVQSYEEYSEANVHGGEF